MCWCILTHGNNQEGPSQTIWMFVKHEIAFDSAVGNFSCILVLFDCLKVPTTPTIHDFSALWLGVTPCFLIRNLSDGGVTATDGHRGSGTVADGCSRLQQRLGCKVGGGGGGGRDFPDVNVSLSYLMRPRRPVVRPSTEGNKRWENPLRGGSLVERRRSSGKWSRLTAPTSQGTLVKKKNTTSPSLASAQTHAV